MLHHKFGKKITPLQKSFKKKERALKLRWPRPHFSCGLQKSKSPIQWPIFFLKFTECWSSSSGENLWESPNMTDLKMDTHVSNRRLGTSVFGVWSWTETCLRSCYACVVKALSPFAWPQLHLKPSVFRCFISHICSPLAGTPYYIFSSTQTWSFPWIFLVQSSFNCCTIQLVVL